MAKNKNKPAAAEPISQDQEFASDSPATPAAPSDYVLTKNLTVHGVEMKDGESLAKYRKHKWCNAAFVSDALACGHIAQPAEEPAAV